MKRNITFITIVVTVILIGVGCIAIQSKKYNSGYCINCGKPYEETPFIFNGTSGTSYECKDCNIDGMVYDWWK